MSKELTREEKIENIISIIKGTKEHLKTKGSSGFDMFLTQSYEHLIEILERELKLLSLPTRTIETLEIGDYVEFEQRFASGNWILFKETVSEICKMDNKLIYCGDRYIRIDEFRNEKLFRNIKIIPHEAIELLKEVVGNE